ncbi:Protein FAR1-RELATED SEQUENCE 5 isoform E [Glycine soja]|uniref:Protein FAR1-RELATED SEQUENCE 5 isoform E n=1 Tax=Glycine soja TaxID=3848 RepID=A0A445GNF6_GLYSO|nr:Protein FAR1-RELATED SEQUENCE 5 isoform E [Glycine soja]
MHPLIDNMTDKVSRHLSNVTPWITTVGTGTLDRDFLAYVALKNGFNFSGVSLYHGNALPNSHLPLVYAGNGSKRLDDEIHQSIRDGVNTVANDEELVANAHLLLGYRSWGTKVGIQPSPVVVAFNSRGCMSWLDLSFNIISSTSISVLQEYVEIRLILSSVVIVLDWTDDSDLDMQAEISDKHEKVDEFSKNLEICGGEDEMFVEQPVADISTDIEAVEPFIGMEFNSREEAREFYIAYGRRIGFTVRIHHNRRSRVNNQVIGQDFVCSKEGFRAKKYLHRKDRVLPPPPATREGCQAMIRLALRDRGKWVVTKFVKEHTHKLMSPSKVPCRGSGKHLVSEDEKDKRIRELSLELYNERQKCKRRCAAYEEQLNVILNDLEKHTEHISKKVAAVVRSIREIEEEKSDSDGGQLEPS